MSGPVDVLAVMDREIQRAGGEAYQVGRELIEARAAVAELIGVAQEIIPAGPVEAADRFSAALARCRGEA